MERWPAQKSLPLGERARLIPGIHEKKGTGSNNNNTRRKSSLKPMKKDFKRMPIDIGLSVV
jgi:hypothetical protein